jgi:hypothetical protein
MPYEVKGDLHCWIWTGLIEAQTPVIRTATSKTTARRYHWERENGRPVPEGKVLTPRCGERLCVRPYHMDVVTPAEMVARTRPPKVTPAMKKRMSVLINNGMAQREVARLMGIDEGAVRYHRKREFA